MRKLLRVFARNPDARLIAGLFLLFLLLLPAMAFIFERLSVIRPRPAVADPPTAAAPPQELAQNIKLTLNCQYESVEEYDGHGLGPTKELSGSFSAIVHMKQDNTGTFALIEATTIGCFDYVGSFTDLVVTGDCERTVAGLGTDKATLTFNRFSGEFNLTSEIGKSLSLYHGHCVPAKKLF